MYSQRGLIDDIDTVWTCGRVDVWTCGRVDVPVQIDNTLKTTVDVHQIPGHNNIWSPGPVVSKRGSSSLSCVLVTHGRLRTCCTRGGVRVIGPRMSVQVFCDQVL